MRIVFMGSPEYAVTVLDLLILNGHDVVAIYTRPDKPAGRGGEPLPTPVKTAALFWHLPLIEITDFRNSAVVAGLARWQPQVIVVGAFGVILPRAVLDIPPYGCLNIHPSLLPHYRGPAPVVAAILAGDQFAGVSVMQLDDGIDSGPVFSHSQISVLDHDDAPSLTDRLFRTGAAMLLEVLAALPGGQLLPVPQVESQATVTRELQKEDGRVDWTLPAITIWRQLRAYRLWPESYTDWNNRRLKILEAFPVTSVDSPGAGIVTALPQFLLATGAGFAVGTGHGVLGVSRVQIEGKRAVPAREFIRGHKEFLGSRLR